MYADTEIFTPTSIAVVIPNMMFGIARKNVMKPIERSPMGSQLKGVRSLRIRDGHESEMKKLNVPWVENLIIPVTAR